MLLQNQVLLLLKNEWILSFLPECYTRLQQVLEWTASLQADQCCRDTRPSHPNWDNLFNSLSWKYPCFVHDNQVWKWMYLATRFISEKKNNCDCTKKMNCQAKKCVTLFMFPLVSDIFHLKKIIINCNYRCSNTCLLSFFCSRI